MRCVAVRKKERKGRGKRGERAEGKRSGTGVGGETTLRWSGRVQTRKGPAPFCLVGRVIAGQQQQISSNTDNLTHQPWPARPSTSQSDIQSVSSVKSNHHHQPRKKKKSWFPPVHVVQQRCCHPPQLLKLLLSFTHSFPPTVIPSAACDGRDTSLHPTHPPPPTLRASRAEHASKEKIALVISVHIGCIFIALAPGMYHHTWCNIDASKSADDDDLDADDDGAHRGRVPPSSL